MKFIVSGTNRPNSRSMMIARQVQKSYLELGDQAEIVDLRALGMDQLDGSQYSQSKPAALQKMADGLLGSQGVTFVVPEYNGSMPGILKYFIDHWAFPDTFEYRPCCFIGLGGQFAGLRAVEHLQQVMSYRNAYLYPKRVFVHNVWSAIDKQGEFLDEALYPRIKDQTAGFLKFIRAIENEKIDANSYLKGKAEHSPGANS